MYCRQCGSELPDNSTFCGTCGSKQDNGQGYNAGNVGQVPPHDHSQQIGNQPGTDYPVSVQAGKTPGVDYPVDQSKKKKGKGKGCLISILAAVVVIVLALVFAGGEDPIEKLQADTVKLADTYKQAQIMTYKVLNTDNTQVDYDTWYKGMEKTCQLWQDVEEQSAELEKTCDKAIAKAEKQQAWLEQGEKIADIFLTDTAMAVTRQEINAVFDAAPAGKGIRTLAKYLGTDARTAWGIFQGTQAEISREAYATEKFYEKCETAATVVKDASKVGLFAGGLVLSGGTAASFTVLESGGIVAGGVDLVLELYQDGATIAYGANDDIVATCADFRKGTKPVAAILGLQNLAGNAFDQLTYLSDSMLGLFQDNEVVGINIKGGKDKPTVQLTGMKRDELGGWAKEQGLKTEPKINQDDLKLSKDDVTDTKISDKKNPAPPDEAAVDLSQLGGVYAGTLTLKDTKALQGLSEGLTGMFTKMFVKGYYMAMGKDYTQADDDMVDEAVSEAVSEEMDEMKEPIGFSITIEKLVGTEDTFVITFPEDEEGNREQVTDARVKDGYLIFKTPQTASSWSLKIDQFDDRSVLEGTCKIGNGSGAMEADIYLERER